MTRYSTRTVLVFQDPFSHQTPPLTSNFTATVPRNNSNNLTQWPWHSPVFCFVTADSHPALDERRVGTGVKNKNKKIAWAPWSHRGTSKPSLIPLTCPGGVVRSDPPPPARTLSFQPQFLSYTTVQELTISCFTDHIMPSANILRSLHQPIPPPDQFSHGFHSLSSIRGDQISSYTIIFTQLLPASPRALRPWVWWLGWNCKEIGNKHNLVVSTRCQRTPTCHWCSKDDDDAFQGEQWNDRDTIL